jgi:nicotinate-nucleotide adenylyltransferase
MNIGICGGTFDPFHRGHVETVAAARDVMQWDRILYIPAYRQPFKTHTDAVSGHHRFAMAVLGTLERDDTYVLPIELERGAISYTVDTLEVLRAMYKDDTLDWIIGEDNLAQLDQWKSIDRIFELANFCVLTRGTPASSPADALASRAGAFEGGEDAARPAAETAAFPSSLRSRVTDATSRPKNGAIVFAENPLVPVSSTEIRRRVAVGESIEDLVDPRVARYIHHYGLYRKDQA